MDKHASIHLLCVCSYLSGRVAVCANEVNEYQRSFQFYEDNAKKTLLGTLDEHAVSRQSLAAVTTLAGPEECQRSLRLRMDLHLIW